MGGELALRGILIALTNAAQKRAAAVEKEGAISNLWLLSSFSLSFFRSFARSLARLEAEYKRDVMRVRACVHLCVPSKVPFQSSNSCKLQRTKQSPTGSNISIGLIIGFYLVVARMRALLFAHIKPEKQKHLISSSADWPIIVADDMPPECYLRDGSK